ncbi:hypothetical protein EJ08DRAFT_649138 [Tothia fuscella]|uniref:Uncharacterized protein n=1 Tax=Tothia fuscella TaxID=1048955 RepID=A0A9P4NRZ0_9PEZI|nr:hypothetical protein EJ08DRAFT_649138 [Tothia fuscella]
MNSTSVIPRVGYTCRTCSQSIRHPVKQRRLWTASIPASRHTILPRIVSRRTAATLAAPTVEPKTTKSKEKSFWENEWTIYSADNAHLVRKAQTFGNEILNHKGIPTEEETMKAMSILQFAASQLTRPTPQEAPTQTKESDTIPQSRGGLEGGLLSLDSTKPAHPMSISISIDLLSTLAYKIITHPPVFITVPILESYVKTQSTLQRPQSFPEIFELYATKPAPILDSSPVRYKTPNPNSSTQAIPKEAADMALDAAIAAADLELALGIIESSYTRPAFQRNKFLKNAAPGLSALALAPAAALALASQLPQYTNVADPTQLTYIAFASILTYVTAASTLGFVAITTRNDQMERVTWVTGTPLRTRWLREEERAAMDRVAMAWGFKDWRRRGEEEGAEWEELKVECGLRNMVLDKVSLMEGME